MAWKIHAKSKMVLAAALMAVLAGAALGGIQAVKADFSEPISATDGAFTIYSPLNQTYNSNQLNLRLGFEAFMGMPYVLSYDIDGKHQGTILYTVQKSNETHIEYPAVASLNLPSLPKGAHYITVNMNGVRDTTYTATVYFTVDASIKLTPPTISNLSIQAATYNTTDLPLQFTTNKDVAQVTYSLDGNENVTLNGNTTLTGLADGAHNLTLYVRDNWGNVASQTIAFTIDAPKPTAAAQPSKPFPTAWVAAGCAAALAVALLSILIYTHRKGGNLR